MTEAHDPLRLEYARGPHELRIVRQPPAAGSVSFSATFLANAGWGYDPDGRESVARITTQLLTSGAGTRNRLQLARFLDRAGGTLSAHCDPESAELTVWGPIGSTDALLRVLADAVQRPRFETTDLERVRRQVHERQLRELAQPSPRADRELHRAVFPDGHPYRTQGLGDRRSVDRLTREDLRRFHRQHFLSDGGLLVVTSPLSTSAVTLRAHRLFEGLGGPPPAPLSVPAPSRRGPREIEVDLPGLRQVEVRLGGASIARSDPSFPAAYLADEILGGATLLSRLFSRVRSKGGLAYHASSHLEAMRHGGYWVAEAGTGGERWRKVLPMLRDEVARIAEEPIPRSELDLVRESRLGEVALALESTADAHELALDVAYHHLPEDHWVQWPSILRAVTPAEVNRAAGEALNRHRAATVVVGPIRAK